MSRGQRERIKAMEEKLTFVELRCKEVVNMRDGVNLGHIIDMIFDLHGRIEGIVAPGFRRLVFFRSADDIFIPWCDIKKIGEDIILVELKPRGECRAPECGPKPSRQEECFKRVFELLRCVRPRDCRDCPRRGFCPDFIEGREYRDGREHEHGREHAGERGGRRDEYREEGHGRGGEQEHGRGGEHGGGHGR